MREAIGGSWMLGIVVVFIMLFTAYLAVSINYTKAFKVKNRIINLIEENEGFSTNTSAGNGGMAGVSDDELKRSSKTEDKIYAYLKEVGYATTQIQDNQCPSGFSKRDGGYCVRRVCDGNGSYYKVRTFIKFEIPIFWKTFTIPVSGETKTLYFTIDGIPCS